MINLLPPQVKEQVSYAKRNGSLVKLTRLMLTVALVITASFLGAHWHLNRTLERTKTEQAAKDARITTYSQTEQEAGALSERLTSIKVLQGKQTRFSLLLADLARVIPSGAYINTIALTEDSKKPVIINATADSYQTAASLRNALASSDRIQAVDLGAIINAEAGKYLVDLTISFKPGQFK